MEPTTETSERMSLIGLFATIVLANGLFLFQLSTYVW